MAQHQGGPPWPWERPSLTRPAAVFTASVGRAVTSWTRTFDVITATLTPTHPGSQALSLKKKNRELFFQIPVEEVGHSGVFVVNGWPQRYSITHLFSHTLIFFFPSKKKKKKPLPSRAKDFFFFYLFFRFLPELSQLDLQ